jgi:uncharacterized protein (TIGR03435 family)
MRRFLVLLFLLCPGPASSQAPSQPRGAAPLPPMAADANPSFEVAAIKPGDPDARGKGLGLRGRDFSAENFSVNDLIVFAYGVQVKQIVDGPPWIDKDKFDISAVPNALGQPSAGQWKTMVQKLMADRFKLTFHHEKRELAVFVLTVGKDGPKLSKNENGVPVSGDINMRVAREGMTFTARNVTMADFVSTLQRVVVDRPVVDQTGLADKFDFQLTFAPDGAQFGGMRLPAQSEDVAAPSLFTEIQEQLGLKLEAVKAPADTIVIDHIERPSPN